MNTRPGSVAEPLDAVIVGAGFAGLYMLHQLRKSGLSVQLFEAGDGVGGTWYWNRYPGARCDVDSADYCYSFDEDLQREWQWTERYPSQPEILRYLEHVADRFDLLADITLSARVASARFAESTGLWTVRTDTGISVEARWTIMATGALSSARMPDIEGAGTFAGTTHHTAHWPSQGVDFSGQRVAIIGTGSSGVQAIPVIAQQAAHVTVFQRTPNYTVPAQNRPLDPGELDGINADYVERREMLRESHGGWLLRPSAGSALATDPETRSKEYEARWQEGGIGFQAAFTDIMMDPAANDTAADFVRSKIHEIVDDPATAEALCPRSLPIGAKRLCVGTDYYETFNRDNVTLADGRSMPIDRIVPEGIYAGGQLLEFDSIVFATGFDAMTGSLNAIEIEGRGGRVLQEEWAAGPRTYLGLGVSGFPNFFVLAGPGSPSVMSNVVVSIEQHVEWVAAFVNDMRQRNLRLAEPTPASQDEWVNHVTGLAEDSLYMQANSWYLGANVPGKPRIFMPYLGGVGTYRKICDSVAAEGYRGFQLT